MKAIPDGAAVIGSGRGGRRVALALVTVALLAGCDQKNQYQAPPPPKVAVATPVQQAVTRYLEVTGSTAPVNSVDLVARVPGFLQEIGYQDGASVKRGTTLFTIEPQTYKLKLQQAQAAEQSAKASAAQSTAEYGRQAELGKKEYASQSNVDLAKANADVAQANQQQAQINTQVAGINYSYTSVAAPFDGVVSAHQASIGEYVGGGATPTTLATIVQLDPIHVNFNISEQDVQRIRAGMAQQGMAAGDFSQVVVEVGLQTESGFPHAGKLDYVSPSVDSSTGTLAVRGVFANPDHVLLPGSFVRVRLSERRTANALLVPEAALGSDQGGRYVLVVGSDNVVEQRRVQPGQSVGDLRVIVQGLAAQDRVVVAGVQRAIPGQKVDPTAQSAAAGTPARTE